MRRRLALIMGAALLVAVTACEDMPADLGQPSYVGVGATTEVYYFGDSLSAMAQGKEREQYTTHQPPTVAKWDNTVVGGTRLQNWWPAMGNLPAGSTVVVALGTNNALLEKLNTGDIQNHMNGTLELLREQGVARVVWINISEYTALQRTDRNVITRVRWMNQTMRDYVSSGQYSDIGLEVYDWAAMADPLGIQILHTDKLHHNAFGTTLYGCILYEAVNGPACSADLLEQL